MRPGARRDGGETAHLDQCREDAIKQLRACSSFVLIVDRDGVKEVRVLGACTGAFEVAAAAVLMEHALDRVMEEEE